MRFVVPTRRIEFPFGSVIRHLCGAEHSRSPRLDQGIHFQFSNLEGRRVGRRIGLEVALTQLQFCFGRTQIACRELATAVPIVRLFDRGNGVTAAWLD